MMSGQRAVPAEEAYLAHDNGSNAGQGELSKEYLSRNWSRAFLEVGFLRTAHGDFHGTEWPLGKEHLLNDCLESVRTEIEAGTWPCSDQICRRPAGNLPPIHAELCSNGELYVVDGQLRVLTALWHGLGQLEAYVVEMPDRHRPSP